MSQTGKFFYLSSDFNIFNDKFEHTVSGTLSVKSCGAAAVPQSLIDKNTNSAVFTSLPAS